MHSPPNHIGMSRSDMPMQYSRNMPMVLNMRVKDGLLDISVAAEHAGKSVEEFKKLLEEKAE